jgi:hypothetical protein
MRCERATIRTTPNGRAVRSLCRPSNLSVVRKASIIPLDRRSSSPFLMPAQPSPCTLRTSCSERLEIRSCGRFSSSRTRPSQHAVARLLEGCNRLIAASGWKLTKELGQGLSAFEIVEERLHWNSRSNKDRRAAEDSDRCGPPLRSVTYLGPRQDQSTVAPSLARRKRQHPTRDRGGRCRAPRATRSDAMGVSTKSRRKERSVSSTSP